MRTRVAAWCATVLLLAVCPTSGAVDAQAPGSCVMFGWAGSTFIPATPAASGIERPDGPIRDLGIIADIAWSPKTARPLHGRRGIPRPRVRCCWVTHWLSRCR